MTGQRASAAVSAPSYRRPGASPVLAALFAAGVVRPSHRLLDVGCGNGTDSLALAAWGLAEVVGVDANPEKIAIARRRASRFRLGDWARFSVCPIARLQEVVPPAHFDVALDSLCWNNIHAERPADSAVYVRQVARALRPGGLFILQARVDRHPLQIDQARRALPRCFTRHFELGPVLTTHMPEFDSRYVQVAVTVGRRRREPLRR